MAKTVPKLSPDLIRHPLFEQLGDVYPTHLQDQHDHILMRLAELWDTGQIEEYFSDLMLDKRGGRQGFSNEAFQEIIRLRDIKKSEIFRKSQGKDYALNVLEQRSIPMTTEEFHRAILNGKQALVDLFVRANINVHAEDAEGNPPVILALKKGYTVIAKILLNAGADINAVDKFGVTPLLLACSRPERGHTDVAKFLIIRGALVNLRDRIGNTPLMLSLSGGSPEIAELLIKKGADIFASNKDGQTALSLAEQEGNAHLVRLLQEKAARIGMRRAEKEEKLAQARKYGKVVTSVRKTRKLSS